MANTESGLARRLVHWSFRAAIVGLAACGGGADNPPLPTTSGGLQAVALRQPGSALHRHAGLHRTGTLRREHPRRRGRSSKCGSPVPYRMAASRWPG